MAHAVVRDVKWWTRRAQPSAAVQQWPTVPQTHVTYGQRPLSYPDLVAADAALQCGWSESALGPPGLKKERAALQGSDEATMAPRTTVLLLALAVLVSFATLLGSHSEGLVDENVSLLTIFMSKPK